MKAIEALTSVLCDPEGKCCISGSDDDRRLIDSALADLAANAADRAIEGCPELNMGNYDEVGVERLNDWAIRANDEIDRLHALAAGQATAQPAPENIRGILARCRDFIDTTKAPAYPAGADLADEIDVLLAAQPAPQPSQAAQAVVQDDLITIRKPTTRAEMLWLLKLAHLVISDVDKTLEETFAPAQPAAQQGAAYAEMTEKYYLAGGEVPTWDVDQMRAFADATHALRVESLAAAYCEELDKLSQRNYELRLASHGQAPTDAKALAEADRRAGEAERLLATCKEDVMRFEQVRSRMKYQWGAEQRVSFDEVWDEALALKKAAQAAPQAADSVQEDAARYRFLRDGEWRDTDLEPFIRLQLNTLWDAKIDAARAAQEGGK